MVREKTWECYLILSNEHNQIDFFQMKECRVYACIHVRVCMNFEHQHERPAARVMNNASSRPGY
jgi:hypothetical protein